MTLDPRHHLRAAARTIATLAILCTTGVNDARAEAHNYQVPGSSGHAWPNADENCFDHSWTVMTNGCSTTKKLVFAPTVLSDLLSISVYVRGSASSIGGVTCQAFAQSVQVNSIEFTPKKSTIGLGALWQVLNLGSLNVNKDEALQIECSVSPGMSVSEVMVREAL